MDVLFGLPAILVAVYGWNFRILHEYQRALNKESSYEISLKLDEKCSRGITYSSQIVFFQSLHYTCFSSAVCPLQVPGSEVGWPLLLAKSIFYLMALVRLGSNCVTMFVQQIVNFSLVKQEQRVLGRKHSSCTNTAVQFDPSLRVGLAGRVPWAGWYHHWFHMQNPVWNRFVNFMFKEKLSLVGNL